MSILLRSGEHTLVITMNTPKEHSIISYRKTDSEVAYSYLSSSHLETGSLIKEWGFQTMKDNSSLVALKSSVIVLFCQ